MSIVSSSEVSLGIKKSLLALNSLTPGLSSRFFKLEFSVGFSISRDLSIISDNFPATWARNSGVAFILLSKMASDLSLRKETGFSSCKISSGI